MPIKMTLEPEVKTFDLRKLDEAEVEKSYRENGYAVVDRVLSSEELEEIRRDFMKINRGDYPCEGIDPVDWDPDDKRLLARHVYMGMPHVLSNTIHRFVTHPGLLRVLDLVVGAFVPFWDGGYNCVQTMFVSKGPYGKGSPWHQDEHPIPTRDRSLTGVWIPTEDVDSESGCLWIVPDSHKSGIIYDRHPHDEPDIDFQPIARGFDESTAIPLPMKAGSVIFFSGYLLHSARKSSSDAYRPVLTLHYTSATTLLTWKGERNYRGVIPIKGVDPYAEEGYTTPTPWAHLAR
jgi:ectoine hydroxylase-related dioxygenase (phytanoyl-CoA dioxygenase family)